MRPKKQFVVIVLGSSFICTILPCGSRDLGVVGSVFEIKEQSLLEVIHKRLRDLQASDKLQGYQKELQKRVRLSIERPQAIQGIGRSTKYQSRNYDPSFVLDEDIKDHKENVIATKGTTYNPLDYRSFGKPLLLINGDDIAQVKWALSEEGKIVLVQGAPLHLAKEHNRIFYFDQGAVLVRKFSISKVPTRISQKEKVLLIEEIPLGDSTLSNKTRFKG